MDCITLTGVQAMGTHGVLDSEHAEPQSFVVDAVMYLDLSDATRSDDLTDTVSYAQIADRIVSIIEGEHVDLIERLAQKIADAVLLSYRIRRVIITVHKPHAPIEVSFNDVSVTIEREQKDALHAASYGTQQNSEYQHSSQYSQPRQDNLAPEVKTHTAIIAMGGNTGDVPQTLRSAVVAIDAIPGNQITGISPLYRTTAWGMDAGTPDFNNAIVEVSTTLDAKTLLGSLQMIEAAHGRTREIHWGSRPLDLDIVDFDGEVSADPDLTLPHPRAWQRAFVLAPWLDIESQAVLQGVHGGNVVDLVRFAPDRAHVERISDDWILGGAQ